jgi:hypothetical protein
MDSMRSIGFLILSVTLTLPIVAAHGQPATCPPGGDVCRGIKDPALCAALQQRCGGGSHGAAATNRYDTGKEASVPVQIRPEEFPDCQYDEEIVAVPAIACSTLASRRTKGEDPSGALCSDNGFRLECRKLR